VVPTIPVFGDYVCSSIVVVFLLALLALLLLPKVSEVRTRRPGRQRVIAVVIVVLMVALSVYMGAIYVEYRGWADRRELDYALNVTAPDDSSGLLWLPLSRNSELQEAIEVVGGNGSVTIEATMHGVSLVVQYRGNVSIEGTLVTWESVGDWKLTMLNNDLWRPRYAYWIHLARTAGDAPGIEFRFAHHTYIEDDWYSGTSVPVDGWGTFNIYYDHVQRYY
jgi:hypothetical protein